MKDNIIFRIWTKNQTINQIEQKSKKKESGKWRTVFTSLHYASKRDITMLILSIICAIISGIFTPFTVYFFLGPTLTEFIRVETPGNLFNVSMSSVPSVLKRYTYDIFLTGVISLFVALFQIWAVETTARNIVTEIKTAYLSKMLSIEVSWYDDSQEQFVNTVSNDLQKMMRLFDSGMTTVVDICTIFIFGVLSGFVASWKVALLALVIMLMAIIVIYYILKMSKKKAKKREQYTSRCTKITSEVLENVRTVTAYGGEYKEIERYKSTLMMANKYGLKYTTILAAGVALNYFLLCVCYMAAYYFSVRLYLIGDFNPGDIVIILAGQVNAIYNFTFTMNIISDIDMAIDSTYRVMRFLNNETSYGKSIEQGIEPDTFKPDISFRNVQFFYSTNVYTKVLQDLTLDIEPGKVTAIVGTSGAGKSTIVNLISRLYDVTGGQILIGGVDIRKLNFSWLRNQIGVVGQEPMLFDTSIEDNIRFGKNTATMEEIIEAAKISRAHRFIEKLPSGYASVVGETGTKLSGGQKQMIAIARALVRKPKLLLLDEATSALDVHSEGIVQEALDIAMRERTTLIITHRMLTVRKADVIYALKEGRVIEKGSHSELMDLKGYYYSLAKTQELDEKDKVLTLSQGFVPREELFEEAKPIIKDILEVAENKKELGLNMEKLKTIVVWILAILFLIFSSTYLPAFYYIFSLFCQSFTYAKDELSDLALINVAYLFGLGIILLFSVVICFTMSTIATQLWLEKVQKKAFNKIVSMDIGWFDGSGNSPKECLEVLTNSPKLIESVTGDRAAHVIIFVLSVMFSYVYSYFISPSVTLANLSILLIFLIINGLRMRSKDADARSAALITMSTKEATEYVQNIKTIQILNCQKFVIDQYQDKLVRSKKEAFRSIVWFAAVYSFSKTFMRWAMCISFIYGANAIATGDVRGTFLIGVVIALTLASTLAGPALILTSQYPAAQQAIKRLYRIANTKTSLDTLSDHKAKPKINGNVVFRDITFSYPTRDKVQVLKKLNIEIEAGTTVALVGDSGCGKSTIISLLERFYLPNEGTILIDGKDINDINVRYLRSQIGLVSQEPVLFDMTIKENIIYGLEEEVTMDKIIHAAKIANIHNFIMKLPQVYDTMVGDRGSKLSGGQKQRIAIARAVLRNPKILLLDEATSALDTENETIVQEALENASAGRTNIVIAHRLSTIRKADKIIVLQNGEVIEEGNHEQLMKKRGHYYSLLNK